MSSDRQTNGQNIYMMLLDQRNPHNHVYHTLSLTDKRTDILNCRVALVLKSVTANK